jgi:hypothetical protein
MGLEIDEFISLFVIFASVPFFVLIDTSLKISQYLHIRILNLIWTSDVLDCH